MQLAILAVLGLLALEGQSAQIRGYRQVVVEQDAPISDVLGDDVKGGDGFITLGPWRIGAFSCDFFSISHQSGQTPAVFAATGVYTPGPNTAANLWTRSSGPVTNVKAGNGFLEFRGCWRLGEKDSSYLSIAFGRTGQNLMVVRLWKSDGLIVPGNSDGTLLYGLWDASKSPRRIVTAGDRFIRVGTWVLGDVDGTRMSITNMGTAQAIQGFNSDGTSISVGVPIDWSLFARAAQSNVMVQKLPSQMTWDQQNLYAQAHQGRLLQASEAKWFLQTAAFKGQEAWAAVVQSDGTKDWIQAGDVGRPTGELFSNGGDAFPCWGNGPCTSNPYKPQFIIYSAPWFYLRTSSGAVPVQCGDTNKIRCMSSDGASCSWNKVDRLNNFDQMMGLSVRLFFETDCPGWLSDAGANPCVKIGCVAPAKEPEPVESGSTASAPGTCASFVCPVNYVLKPQAASLVMPVPMDSFAFCCDQTCIGFNCSRSYVLRRDYVNISGVVSNDLCCVPGTCTDLQCPPLMVMRSNVSNIMSTNPFECCAKACTGFACPVELALRKDADTVGGISAQDCCYVPRCSYFICPKTYKRIPNAYTIKAESLEVCCVFSPPPGSSSCLLFQCPEKQALKSNAKELIGETPEDCCDKQCSLFQCPTGLTNDPATASVLGQSSDTCCMVSVCSVFVCPPAYAPVKNSFNVVGSSVETCCTMSLCMYFRCPDGYLPDPKMSQILGNTADLCCLPSCQSYSCPPGTSLKLGAEQLPQTEICCSTADLAA